MRRRLDQNRLKKLGVPALLLIALFISGFSKNSEQACQVSSFLVETDSVNFEFFQVKNNQGLPLFYYQDIDQYPCEDSVCARMVLRVYWDLWGNFLKIGLEDNQQLTKIGHEPFSDKDYARLHKLLIDPDCNLQYYELDDLTDKESEKVYYSVDAVSSATIQDVTYDSVKGAVKTCYSLWKIVHGEIQNQIKVKTAEALDKQITNDRLQEMTALIVKDEVPAEDVLKSIANQLEISNTAYLLSLLELNRQASDVSKDLMEKLTGFIQNKQSVSETAIYNFLLQADYTKKEVRKYELSRNYF